MPEPEADILVDKDNLAVDSVLRLEAGLIATACINDSLNNRSDLAKEWADARKLWAGISISKVFHSDEVKHVPEPYNRSESITPRIYRGLFGVTPWFLPKAKREEYKDYDETIYEYIMWQFTENDWQFYTDQEDGIRNMVIDGTVFYKSAWITEQVSVADRKIVEKRILSKDGEEIATYPRPGPLTITDQEHAFPRDKPIDVADIVVDRYVSSLRDARYIGDRYELRLGEVKRRRDKGYWVNTEPIIDKHEDLIQRKANMALIPPDLRNLTFYELWTYMVLEGVERPVVITLAEVRPQAKQAMKQGDLVVRIERNRFPGGFRPYSVGQFIKRSGQIYGVGAIIPIRGLSEELDEWRTMSLRAQELAISPPFIARDEMELENEQLFLYPGKILYSRTGKDGLTPVTIPVNQMGTYHVERIIRSDIAQTTRSPETFMGASAGGRETAFEVNRKVQEAGLGLSQIVARYRLTVIKPILRNRMALNAMHVDEDKLIRKVGAQGLKANPFMEITPAQLQMQYDFDILDSAEVAMMGTRTQQFVAFMQAMPPEAASSVRWDRIMEAFLKAMGQENPDEYIHRIKSPSELLSVREEMRMILTGKEPPIEEGTDHQFHWGLHKMFMGSDDYEKLTPQQKLLLQSHLERTEDAMQKQIEREMQTKRMMAMMAQQGQGQQGGRTRQAQPITQTGQMQAQNTGI